MQYEEPKKGIAEQQAATKKRLQDQKKLHAMYVLLVLGVLYFLYCSIT